MRFRVTRLPWRASVALFVAVVWLPQLALPCFAGTGGRRSCHGFSRSAPAREDVKAGVGKPHTGHRCCGSKPASSPDCCQMTGKCKPGALASAPAFEPPALVEVMLPIADVVLAYVDRAQPRPVQFAHGPPIYLRLATLLI